MAVLTIIVRVEHGHILYKQAALESEDVRLTTICKGTVGHYYISKLDI